jgi:hypothetical protein
MSGPKTGPRCPPSPYMLNHNGHSVMMGGGTTFETSRVELWERRVWERSTMMSEMSGTRRGLWSRRPEQGWGQGVARRKKMGVSRGGGKGEPKK